MQCPDCGAFYNEGDEFCGECGLRLGAETPPGELPSTSGAEGNATATIAPVPEAPRPTRSRSRSVLTVGGAIFILLILCAIGAGILFSALEEAAPSASDSVPAAGVRLLYHDDFRDPASGWDAWDDGGTSGKYVDGEYRLTVALENYMVWSHPAPDREFKDFAVEVDARQIHGSLDGSFGLIVRHDVDKERYYWFQISGSGHYWVEKKWEGEWILLEEGDASDAVKEGLDATNEIQVICYRDRFRFSVNNTLVTELTDDALRTGIVGLAAGAYAEPVMVVLFDNLRVYALED